MISVSKSIIQATVTGMAMELVTVVTPVHGNTTIVNMRKDVLHLKNCIRVIVMVMEYQMNVITAPMITTLSSLILMAYYLVKRNKSVTTMVRHSQQQHLTTIMTRKV